MTFPCGCDVHIHDPAFVSRQDDPCPALLAEMSGTSGALMLENRPAGKAPILDAEQKEAAERLVGMLASSRPTGATMALEGSALRVPTSSVWDEIAAAQAHAPERPELDLEAPSLSALVGERRTAAAHTLSNSAASQTIGGLRVPGY